ncbi:McrC family protein [Paenibacillus sabinae]|uniref:McrBC 5-methylcytosine restriction system component n=1 Tax=Paenibacillus sabinae T27 TaxID=1268072 RepID=X4ZZ27_9BACL|nr:McrC family protein [Paenibacillus sabinae]AHV97428.1 McrBC 5-methylcytosine restriction system component [Paenibacillus sabinae T27]
MRNKKKYTIKEYDSFTKNPDVQLPNFHFMPEPVFDCLEQFVLTNRQVSDTDLLELMVVTSRRGIGKVISARNYVGVINMNNETEIEILPKLYSRNEESSEGETKQIFLKMLKSLLRMPYKHFNVSSLDQERYSILDILIRMFIEEVYTLVKRGLKSAYVDHEDNEFFYKGRLKFSEHIRLNAVHKERFYIEYDVFSVDRPENRLIKSTIGLLQKVCSSRKLQKDLHTLSDAFESVEFSTDYTRDFAKVTDDRHMSEYTRILQWCRVFLTRNSFTPFSGGGVAYALLFPMEKVFESYVTGHLKKIVPHPEYLLMTQHRLHHLYDEPKQRFLLKPDIVVARNGRSVILDTKWKMLSTDGDHGISQSDMYQAYAYHKKYNAETVILVYPWTTALSEIRDPIEYRSNDGVRVQVYLVDLSECSGGVARLGRLIEGNLLGD